MFGSNVVALATFLQLLSTVFVSFMFSVITSNKTKPKIEKKLNTTWINKMGPQVPLSKYTALKY